MSVSDRIHTSLVSYGGSTIDERVYNYLGSLGLTGTISDRLAKYNHNGKKGWQAIIEGFGLSLSAGFVRQELFGESQQGVFYVSQPSYLGQQVLYQDAAGTIPVTADGDPVGLMLDLSPNGHNASQSTSAARPLYRTDGVLHWLELDGVDDFMVFNQTIQGTISRTAMFAYQAAGTATTSYLLDAGRRFGGASGSYWGISAEDTALFLRVLGFAEFSPGPGSESSVSTIAWGSELGAAVSDSRAWNNGSELVVTDGTSDSIDTELVGQSHLFTSGGETDFFSGNFYGSIIVNDLIIDSRREVSENYLASLAGITL